MNISCINTTFKRLLSRIYNAANDLDIQNIYTAIRLTGPHRSLLDVGCWDGERTIHWAKVSKAKKIYGIEPVKSAAGLARSKGIKTYIMPADKIKWLIPDNSIDCIVSNQVIEHLTDLDRFFTESVRVLAPGGVIITSTNNLSSLHNIVSIIMGWAPFDLANSSYHSSSIGNPFSLHKNDEKCVESTWTHKCVYTAYWLNRWQMLYGLKPVKTLGAGLYPFPAGLGKVFPRYAAFITTVCQKQARS